MRAIWPPRSRAGSACRWSCPMSWRRRRWRWRGTPAARRSAPTRRWRERADVLVLCHKPGQLQEVAEQVGGRAKVVVTILAATTTEEVEEHYPGVPVYRFIPNIPVEVGRGVLCYAAGSRAAEGPEREILELFGRAGLVIPLDDESLLEPAMALMSCGPAFMALVAESFVDAGVHHGLARDDASRMVVETMAGTAEYLKAHDLDTEALRVKVATPWRRHRARVDEARGRRHARGRAGSRSTRWSRRRSEGSARGDARRRRRLRQHARTRLSGPDLHQDHHELDPADPVQPLPRHGARLRERT